MVLDFHSNAYMHLLRCIYRADWVDLWKCNDLNKRRVLLTNQILSCIGSIGSIKFRSNLHRYNMSWREVPSTFKGNKLVRRNSTATSAFPSTCIIESLFRFLAAVSVHITGFIYLFIYWPISIFTQMSNGIFVFYGFPYLQWVRMIQEITWKLLVDF